MSEKLSDEMCKEILTSGINRILDDGRKILLRSDLLFYGKGNLSVVLSSIKVWESRGLLKILKSPETAAEEDACIEMLKYIDRDSPQEGWPS